MKLIDAEKQVKNRRKLFKQIVFLIVFHPTYSDGIKDDHSVVNGAMSDRQSGNLVCPGLG